MCPLYMYDSTFHACLSISDADLISTTSPEIPPHIRQPPVESYGIIHVDARKAENGMCVHVCVCVCVCCVGCDIDVHVCVCVMCCVGCDVHVCVCALCVVWGAMCVCVYVCVRVCVVSGACVYGVHVCVVSGVCVCVW